MIQLKQAYMKSINLQNRAVFSRAPEHEGQVRSGGDSLHSASVIAKHLCRLASGDVVNSDFRISSTTHHDSIVRLRQKL